MRDGKKERMRDRKKESEKEGKKKTDGKDGSYRMIVNEISW